MKSLMLGLPMYGVIMAGGRGTRFWPKSRIAWPKHLQNIVSCRSMLQETVERIQGVTSPDRIVIVTGAQQATVVRTQIPAIAEENLILEPIGRNTAPCICLAALHIAASDPDAIMTVLPADHYIARPDMLQRVLEQAAAEARLGDVLVTIGITPTYPETGYGYIEYRQTPDSAQHGAHPVVRFHEKPSRDQACRLIEMKHVVWNSGMFVWKASAILKAIQTYLPDIYDVLIALDRSLPAPDYRHALERAYAAIRPISIDYGVLEKADNVKTIPGDFGWNDIGSWSAVYDLSDKDAGGNVFRSEVRTVGVRNVLVDAPGKMTALIGVQNLIVIDTGDCLMICSREHAQDIKKIVDMLDQEGKTQYL
jgi:mannose-1-phosphate guanylyltransferase